MNPYVRAKNNTVSPRYSKSFIFASNRTLVYAVVGQKGDKKGLKKVKKG
jgi:hypothetical protein